MGLTLPDSCESCMVAILPFRVVVGTIPRSVIALYHCRECKRSWFTYWNTDALGEAS